MKSDGAGRLHALHRFVRDLGRFVVQQRNQQPAEARVVDVTDRRRDISPATFARRRASVREIDEAASAASTSAGLVAAGERDGGGDPDPRLGVGQQRPRQTWRRPRC